MTSQAYTNWPIMAAMVEAEKFLGPNRHWQPAKPMQESFLVNHFWICRKDVAKFSEIVSKASRQVEELNEFLRSQGFSIQLQPFGPKELGMVGILKLLSKWESKGEKKKIQTQSGVFPGVLLNDESVEYFRSPDNANPIIKIRTRSGDEVFMTMWDEPLSGFDLIRVAQNLSEPKQRVKFKGVIFPMVCLDQQFELDWLKNLTTVDAQGNEQYISQALMQIKFRMNEIGASVEAAFAGAVSMGIDFSTGPHIINRPFLIWFKRYGLAEPIFAGRIDYCDWKDPGKL